MKSLRRAYGRWLWLEVAGLLFGAAVARAQTLSPVIEVPNPPNVAAQLAKPYVVLVSLDGFRYDYAERYGAKNLLALARRGASAPKGMIPSYPSVTFPNHYTLVTGLYPEHHGIVANTFYDPERQQQYSFADPGTLRDGSWYGGTPLWVLAESEGMRAACLFWPGSEAEIQGRRPSYYLTYDEKLPDEARIEQVLDWLRLPPERRPHFITLYYSIVDHTGHAYGPEAPETAEAVRHVDELIGKLEAGLDKLHLPTDLFVVSDHGMEKVQGGGIYLDRFADLSDFVIVNEMMYPKSEAAAQAAYLRLRGASDKFQVYRRKDFPGRLRFDANPRSGDPIMLLKGPYVVRARAPQSESVQSSPAVGQHGYDPEAVPAMKAIFYAAGPDIRAGAVLPPFENIHVYPLIAKILGLHVGQIDGELSVLQGILNHQTSSLVPTLHSSGTPSAVRFDFFPPAP
jgi:predicted AlkP superfamily pyrophosphatase or phosphodiesterase